MFNGKRLVGFTPITMHYDTLDGTFGLGIFVVEICDDDKGFFQYPMFGAYRDNDNWENGFSLFFKRFSWDTSGREEEESED